MWWKSIFRENIIELNVKNDFIFHFVEKVENESVEAMGFN